MLTKESYEIEFLQSLDDSGTSFQTDSFAALKHDSYQLCIITCDSFIVICVST